jgi:DNA invertase Pin-like site-specific DNA recombinase
MKRAALYVRVSSLDQHPETQLHDLRQFASQRGFQIVQEYVDHGFCGARARRPELDRMMEDARRHKFDVLMVWACDRLARSTKHLLQTLDELSGFGIQFLSQREAIDAEGPLRQSHHRHRVGDGGTGAVRHHRARQGRYAPGKARRSPYWA